MRRSLMLAVVVILVLLVGACEGSTPNQADGGSGPASEQADGASSPEQDQAERIKLQAGLVDEVVVAGLEGPTQALAGPDGRLWVAQLAGAEGDGTGQVVAVDLAGDGGVEPEVLLDGLQKPTGIAVAGDALWVQTERTLGRAPLNADALPGTLQPVLEGLPYNGRSEGTLTVTGDGDVLFETSGRREGSRGQAGSGTLQVQSSERTEAPPRMLASGLKNAYAHVYDAEGRLFATEIAEPLGRGTEAASDELNLVQEGGDYGWPPCLEDREPAPSLDVAPGACDETIGPVATFPPASTPTGVADSPFTDDVVLVALWATGEIVAVDTSDPDAWPVEPRPFASGYENPQHLYDPGDGTLLLTEFSTGSVHRISAVDAEG